VERFDSPNSNQQFPKPGWQFPENGSLPTKADDSIQTQTPEQELLMRLIEQLARGLQEERRREQERGQLKADEE
jgi:hypothetical protein